MSFSQILVFSLSDRLNSKQHSTTTMKGNFLSAGLSIFPILCFFSFFTKNNVSVNEELQFKEFTSSKALMLTVDAGQDLSL